MSQVIPQNLATSAALKYVTLKGWNWRGGDGGQIQIENCAYCGKGDYKFYMAVGNSAEGTRDGLFSCFHGSCQRTGNLKSLQEHLGDRIAGVDSRKEWAGSNAKQDALPNAEECHAALLGDADALDYLINVRGFTQEVIDRQKLGLKERVYFRQAGETRALVIPYLSIEGNTTFAKYRTLPPSEKDFISPSGHEAGLYNAPALVDGCEEIIIVEGESDALSCMSNGVDNVVGVPGAGVKKAAWLETLDRVNPARIYILYDNDKAGNKGAQDMASRIGIDKCLKIVLPEGTKDVNQYFVSGKTKEDFDLLKASARQFDVTGVSSSMDALGQLEDELSEKVDLAPTYISPWPELNKLVGFENGDVIDICAPEKVGKTNLGLNIMDHMVAQYGEDGLVVCLEMTQARLARRWVSLLTGFEDTITEPGTPESKAKLEELKAACVVARNIQRNREADLYFAYPQMYQDDPEVVFKLIRDCIRRYGVKWVMIDNLQKLCDDTLKNQGFRTIHLSQLSKKFATLAKDYKIKLIRILQPKRIGAGQIISTNDTDGSSQIGKDCDCMITMWRKALGADLKISAYDQEADTMNETSVSFDEKTMLTVGLSRYSSGGRCFLHFEGAKSKLSSYDDVQKQELRSKNYNGIVYAGGVPTEAPSTQEKVTI